MSEYNKDSSFVGLVSISGGGSIFPNWAAFVIGLITGVLYFICSQLVKLARLIRLIYLSEASLTSYNCQLVSCACWYVYILNV